MPTLTATTQQLVDSSNALLTEVEATRQTFEDLALTMPDAGGVLRTTVINGDIYRTINAFWDGAYWQRLDVTRPAWMEQINQANNMLYESYKAITVWNAQPGANPIGAFTAIGGWLMVQSISQFRDVTVGGNGFELDGNGTFPYGRLQHTTVGGVHATGLLKNAYLDEQGRDNAVSPSWFAGFRDDVFAVRRAPSGDSLVWSDLLRINAAGVLSRPAASLAVMTDAATIAVYWDVFTAAEVTLAGNRLLDNPSGVETGSTRRIVVKGVDATARTLTFGANFKGALPTLADITATRWYLLTLFAVSAAHIVVSAVQAL